MHRLCASKFKSEISPLKKKKQKTKNEKHCFKYSSVTENYEFDALRTFIFYQFREWKLAEPPYEVSVVGKTPRGRKLKPTENTCGA